MARGFIHFSFALPSHTDTIQHIPHAHSSVHYSSLQRFWCINKSGNVEVLHKHKSNSSSVPCSLTVKTYLLSCSTNDKTDADEGIFGWFSAAKLQIVVDYATRFYSSLKVVIPEENKGKLLASSKIPLKQGTWFPLLPFQGCWLPQQSQDPGRCQQEFLGPNLSGWGWGERFLGEHRLPSQAESVGNELCSGSTV